MPNKSFTSEQLIFVVTRLALYDSPQEVADQFYEEFGDRIARQNFAAYDASKPWARRGMSPKWIALFDVVRDTFNTQVLSIPIANKSVRLRRLEKLYNSTQSPTMRLSILEQAAKEMGGAYDAAKNRELPAKGNMIQNGIVFVLPQNGRGANEALKTIPYEEARRLTEGQLKGARIEHDPDVEEAKVVEETRTRAKELKKPMSLAERKRLSRKHKLT